MILYDFDADFLFTFLIGDQCRRTGRPVLSFLLFIKNEFNILFIIA